MQKDPNYLTDNKIRIFNEAGQETQAAAGQLVLRRGDPLPLPPGSRRRRQLDGLRAHQHPEPLRRLHARHALEGHLRRRFPLRLLGLRARAERARLHHLAPEGHARLEPRADRRRHRLRPAHRRAPRPAGAASTGPISRPGRRPTASSSSATTSTTRTASRACRSRAPRSRRGRRLPRGAFAAWGAFLR